VRFFHSIQEHGVARALLVPSFDQHLLSCHPRPITSKTMKLHRNNLPASLAATGSCCCAALGCSWLWLASLLSLALSLSLTCSIGKQTEPLFLHPNSYGSTLCRSLQYSGRHCSDSSGTWLLEITARIDPVIVLLRIHPDSDLGWYLCSPIWWKAYTCRR
jgi:hypothetical protein